jgi:transposase
VASVKKKALKEGKTIVFIDESGLSEKPNVVRTWGERGKTPVIQYHFNWKKLSAIAGLTFQSFYFKIFVGSIKSEQIVDFLKHLQRCLGKDVLIVWDGLRAHKSRLVAQYVESLNGKIELAYLPPYAPELNPVEYIWRYWKYHELANYCPKDLTTLLETGKKSLRKMQRRKKLSQSYWRQATLF